MLENTQCAIFLKLQESQNNQSSVSREHCESKLMIDQIRSDQASGNTAGTIHTPERASQSETTQHYMMISLFFKDEAVANLSSEL